MFRRIDLKILTVIGLVVTVGMASLVLFYSDREERNILAQNKRTLVKLVDSTRQGLRTLMASGYGDVGPIFAESLENITDVVDLRLMRPDGVEAFLDNRTIEAINQVAGYEQFYPRDEELRREVLPQAHKALLRVLDSERLVEYYDVTAQGERLYTLLSPVLQEKQCSECHATDQRVLGVIKLTTTLKHVDEDIAASRRESLMFLAVVVLIIMLIIKIFVRRNVVQPIQVITRAMRRASKGKLDQNLPLPQHTEMEQMASSFNHMTRELATIYSGLQKERNKLTTIILGAPEGMVATDDSGRVVLVNPAAEKLLGKGLERIMDEGFVSLFDDSRWMNERIAQQEVGGATLEVIEYNERVLSVQMATIKDDKGVKLGSAALIRDVTQETALQERLKHESRTDMLTGLFNRRYFDEQLFQEFNLAERYREPLSLVLFDIDHFKNFNDTYGHDQGDRVLQAVSKQVQQTVRKVDICCRYGGEEFVVILPDLKADAALDAAENLRLSIEILDVDGLKVTASFGVASAPPLAFDTPEAMVREADQALYAAKQAGRNRVVSALVTSDQGEG